MNRRMERVNFTLRRELGALISEELSDPRLGAMTSVTRVETSPDLATAKVHVTVLGDAQQQLLALEALRSAAGYLRASLDRRVRMRHIPRFSFALDTAIQSGAEMLDLMDRVAAEDRERPRNEEPE